MEKIYKIEGILTNYDYEELIKYSLKPEFQYTFENVNYFSDDVDYRIISLEKLKDFPIEKLSRDILIYLDPIKEDNNEYGEDYKNLFEPKYDNLKMLSSCPIDEIFYFIDMNIKRMNILNKSLLENNHS